MTTPLLPRLKPIAMKHRLSFLFLEKGKLDIIDGAFVLIDKDGARTHIPLGNVGCLMLESGIRISHAAVALAAKVGCLLIWVGEAGIRVYSSGQPGGARADRLLYQAKLALDEQARLKVVRKMYAMRFKDEPPAHRSVDQLRGIEGARVREMYKLFAQRYNVTWNGRNYNPAEWDESDVINRCLSSATACLYGITEAAILAAGYAPAVGFIHTGKPLSFVYDIADIFKFETVVPVAFKVAARTSNNPERQVRLGCRDIFREMRILGQIIPSIDEVLSAGGLELPLPPDESIQPALPNPENIGNVGHRS